MTVKTLKNERKKAVSAEENRGLEEVTKRIK